MFDIRMADIHIRIDNRYTYVSHLCKDYVIESDEEPDLFICVSKEEILDEVALVENVENNAVSAYAEAVCVYRQICSCLPQKFQSFLMHCAVIEYEGEGYAFAAHSGTGKTTHIALWQKYFGDAVRVINGDKPILRFIGDRLYAFGTPWCGKEGFQINASVPLKAICFLERSAFNTIRRISATDAIERLFHQILSPEDLETVDALFPLLNRMLREVPCYLLRCNMSEEAAAVAYQGMKGIES